MMSQLSEVTLHNARRPVQIPPSGWWAVAKRVADQLGADHVSIASAGIAFFGFISIFPAFAAILSLYGLFLDPATVQDHLLSLAAILPVEAQNLLRESMLHLASESNIVLGWRALLSIGLALLSANKGMSAMFEGINIAYNENEKRPFFWRTLLTLVFTTVSFAGVTLGIGLVIVLPTFLEMVGWSRTEGFPLSILRWPVLAATLLIALAFTYRYAPNRADPKWRWVSVGALVATTLWIVASLGFSWYVSYFADYAKMYGSLAAVVILLMSFYLTSYVILLGAEINSELEHQTRQDSTTGPEQPMGERGAYHADHIPSAKKATHWQI